MDGAGEIKTFALRERTTPLSTTGQSLRVRREMLRSPWRDSPAREREGRVP